MAEVVTTVCCQRLPPDITEREFRNLFLFAPGFERSALGADSGGNVIGFGRFASESLALDAIGVLNHSLLDPATSIPIRCSMAQKQLYDPPGKRHAEDELPAPPPKSLRPSRSAPYPGLREVPSQRIPPAAGRPVGEMAPTPPRPRPAFLPPGAEPRDTLHISGLDPATTEAEIYSVLAAVPHFVGMSFVPRPRGTPICFAKFADQRAAGIALARLAAVALPSNPTRALEVQLAKKSLHLTALPGPPQPLRPR